VRTKWPALLGCALISLPLAAGAAESLPTTQQLILTPRLTPASWNAGSGAHFAPMIAVSAPSAGVNHWAAQPALWTAQDAISNTGPHPTMNLVAPSQSRTDSAPECRWPSSVSNAWNCSIKPFTRFDAPVKHTLRNLWPLGK
jgi:hypothetical protein